jgi:predicted S18 family serine protease
MNTFIADHHPKAKRVGGWKLLALAAGSAMLAGCAGNPPTEQFAVTNTVVKSAVAAGGTEYAPVETKAAQDKLAQAETLLQNEKYDEARVLAEEAEWDARVAERKAYAVKAQRALDDAQRGVQEIRNEGMSAPIIVK